MSKIDDAFNKIPWSARYGIDGDFTPETVKDELYTLIEKEVIGEPVEPNTHVGLLQSNQEAQNRLKKHQLQKLRALFGKGEV